MRALSVSPGARFAWREVPVPPPPGPAAAIVHPIAVATCDLDRALALGATPFLLPLHFGHECVAEVLSTGEQVQTVNPGDRVVVPFQISCGRCPRCQAGLTANCQSVPPISMYGFGIGGGHWHDHRHRPHRRQHNGTPAPGRGLERRRAAQ
jgi:alcohol dehydrogenase